MKSTMKFPTIISMAATVITALWLAGGNSGGGGVVAAQEHDTSSLLVPFLSAIDNSIQRNLQDEDDPSNVEILTLPEQICGQTLTGPKKYIIQASSSGATENTDEDSDDNVIYCGSDNGPTVVGTTLDCEGATIKGDYTPPISSDSSSWINEQQETDDDDDDNDVPDDRIVYGLEVKGDAVIKNCIISNFAGRGITTSSTSDSGGSENGSSDPKQVIQNTSSMRNAREGIVIDSNDDCELMSVHVDNNGLEGLVISGSGNKEIKSCTFQRCNTGIWINNSATGDNNIKNTVIEGNNGIGIIAIGQGNTQIKNTSIGSNGQHGLVKLSSTVGTVELDQVDISNNNEFGIYDLSNAPSLLYVRNSNVANNRKSGIRNNNSQIEISCCTITQNKAGGGIAMAGSAMTTITNSNISNNNKVNIDFASGAAVLSNIRACNAERNDIEVGTATVEYQGFIITDTSGIIGSTTCDGDDDIMLPNLCTESPNED